VARQRLAPDALPLVLHQRIWRKLLALFMTLWISVFVLAGGALVAGGLGEGELFTTLAGLGLLIVSGPMCLYWAVQLVPGSCRLLVTSGGFSARHCFITREHGWDEVGRFYSRTYSSPRITDYETVAFTGEEGRVVRLGSFLEELRIRGIASSDILPDTYGYPARELAEFLNQCSERYGERSPDHVPETIPATRGYLIGISVLLLGFIGGFVAWAGAAFGRGDRSTALLALVLAAPFLFALVSGWVRWRRGTLRRGARYRRPGDTERKSNLIPRRGVVDPPPAEHRRDDVHLG
jgi:hypothetical protein